jgi:uncharacterized Rmd1/YagE family protein
MPAALFQGCGSITARALYVGERVDVRALESAQRLALAPLMVRAGEQGCAALLRYGAVVLFGVLPVEEAAFLGHLRPMIGEPVARPETEELELRLDPDADEGVAEGMVLLRAFDLERLQIVADILAKSVVLAYYETSIAQVFERIEPLAGDLWHRGRSRLRSRELLRDMGGTLLIQHRMAWRAEVEDKPEILWERPDLERLFVRLAREYELRERHHALDRKLDLISRTAGTLHDLLQTRRSLRVEWYIVALILVEILLTLYEMFVKHA